jgi:hypothetical protein
MLEHKGCNNLWPYNVRDEWVYDVVLCGFPPQMHLLQTSSSKLFTEKSMRTFLFRFGSEGDCEVQMNNNSDTHDVCIEMK